jgi:hypothetical protein
MPRLLQLNERHAFFFPEGLAMPRQGRQAETAKAASAQTASGAGKFQVPQAETLLQEEAPRGDHR